MLLFFKIFLKAIPEDVETILDSTIP